RTHSPPPPATRAPRRRTGCGATRATRAGERLTLFDSTGALFEIKYLTLFEYARTLDAAPLFLWVCFSGAPCLRGGFVHTSVRHQLRVSLALLAGLLACAASAPSTASASPQLAAAVSQTPVRWTPNVSGGPTVGQTVCNTTLFGTGKTKCNSQVYGTAYVN